MRGSARTFVAALSTLLTIFVVTVTAGASPPLAAQGTEQRALGIESLGDLGGSITGVVAQGTTLLVTQGRYLEIRDVTDPWAPATLSRVRVAARSTVLAVDDSAAYVMASRRGVAEPDADTLYAVDTSDPAAPVLRPGLVVEPNTLHGAAARGGFLYMGGETGLTVFDARGPGQPFVVDQVSFDHGLAAVTVVDGFLMASGARTPVQVFDLSDPAHPAPGALVPDVQATAMAVSGDTLYCAASQELVALDVTAPATPVVVGRVTLGGGDSEAVATAGGVAFVGVGPHGVRDIEHLVTFDVGDPGHMFEMDDAARYVQALTAQGRTVWAAAGPAGLTRFQANDGEVEQVSTERVLGEPTGLQLSEDGRVLLASDRDAELWTLARAPDGRLEPLATLPLLADPWSGPYDWRTTAALAVSGGRAFVGLDSVPDFVYTDGLFVADVADPAAPRLGGLWRPEAEAHQLPTGGLVRGAWRMDTPSIVGERAYVVGGPQLREVDVGGDSPGTARSYWAECYTCASTGPAVAGTTAWLGMGGYLEGVALDDPSGELVLRGRITTGGRTDHLAALADGRLLVAASNALLVANPVTGRIDAALDHVAATRVFVAGDDALVFDTRGPALQLARGVAVVDVHDPSHPVVLGSYAQPDAPFWAPMTAAMRDDSLYVADGENGLEVLRTTPGDVLPTPTEAPPFTPVPTVVMPTEPANPTASATPGPLPVAGTCFLPFVTR